MRFKNGLTKTSNSHRILYALEWRPLSGGMEGGDSTQMGSREQSICSPDAEDSDVPWSRSRLPG